MTTHAPLRSQGTKAISVYHVRGLHDGKCSTSPIKIQGSKLREILFAYILRPLTEDEWKLLESKPFHPEHIIEKLSFEDQVRLGEKPTFLRKELRQRATNYVQESLTDRYPSWWEVYDKDGNRIWKMSPADKASLAEMRRFNNLSPEEKYQWLCQVREKPRSYSNISRVWE